MIFHLGGGIKVPLLSLNIASMTDLVGNHHREQITNQSGAFFNYPISQKSGFNFSIRDPSSASKYSDSPTIILYKSRISSHL
jgi:hypothetical protein